MLTLRNDDNSAPAPVLLGQHSDPLGDFLDVAGAQTLALTRILTGVILDAAVLQLEQIITPKVLFAKTMLFSFMLKRFMLLRFKLNLII